MPVSDDCHTEATNYRLKYRNLKKKFRYLIYENECFQEDLRKAQRRLLKINQDKSFLLDRLLKHERVEESSTDSDVTASSDSENDSFAMKKKKPSIASNSHHFAGIGSANSTTTRPHTATTEPTPKRKKPSAKSPKSGGSGGGGSGSMGSVPAVTIKTEPEESMVSSQGDGHMTSEEIERHLESRQILMDLVPERAPPTVPTEMFSNDVTCLERYMMADDD